MQLHLCEAPQIRHCQWKNPKVSTITTGACWLFSEMSRDVMRLHLYAALEIRHNQWRKSNLTSMIIEACWLFSETSWDMMHPHASTAPETRLDQRRTMRTRQALIIHSPFYWLFPRHCSRLPASPLESSLRRSCVIVVLLLMGQVTDILRSTTDLRHPIPQRLSRELCLIDALELVIGV